ncbi:hypothetical protein I5I04_gp053 [Mycobacterium phage Zapner]|uniref:Uncharacterized protein n=1 Tax=Mycobacterium phage Zapner TaxID=1486474 RepID=A0A059VG35_9CAUD|nr:hypothetical protein I5I04_gp053 [Mycobacterium phage Zapner]AHZ95507.1 hypothetical protein PBI_ZAPNER_53 [Mycobacterium phage Zapner]
MKARVQRIRRKDGSLYQFLGWSVHDADGRWSGDFESWHDAMEWATSFAARVEHWLEVQTRQGRCQE